MILKPAHRLRAIAEIAMRFSYFEDHKLITDTMQFHLEARAKYCRKKLALSRGLKILLQEYWDEQDEECQDFLRECAEKIFHEEQYIKKLEKYHAKMVLFWVNTRAGFHYKHKPRFPNRRMIRQ